MKYRITKSPYLGYSVEWYTDYAGHVGWQRSQQIYNTLEEAQVGLKTLKEMYMSEVVYEETT